MFELMFIGAGFLIGAGVGLALYHVKLLVEVDE